MGKLINLYGLGDQGVDNHVKIIAITAKCIGWGTGFHGKGDESLKGLIVGEKEFGETILQKLKVFDSKKKFIEKTLKKLNIPDAQFEGRLLSLDVFDDKDVTDHVKIIAITAKCIGWEIGFLGKEDGLFMGLVLGEKEFTETILQKLNIFDYLFMEKL